MAPTILQKSRFFSLDIGIDLGTATTLVYVRGKGIVLAEPSVVAIKSGERQPLAVGSEAKRMIGRTPGNIVAIRPMKDGVIADFGVTQTMLSYFIKKAKAFSNALPALSKTRVVVSVPSGITEVERRAVIESAEQAGADSTFLIDEPMAAAIGAGLPVGEPGGSMIIDIGGGTTEVAVISLGGIVVCISERTAGDKMDEAIVQHIKRKYNLLIGERTAEHIKIKIGSAIPMEKMESMRMEIKGRDLVAGLPRTIAITGEEIREALAEPVAAIINAVKSTLEKTPPELAADLVDSGIVLAGGGSQLNGLDLLLEQETGLMIRLADNPETAIVLGSGKSLDELHTLQSMNGFQKRGRR